MWSSKIGKPFLIAIAGGSASGKSTLAKLIRDSLPSGYCVVLPLDNYYRSRAELERGLSADVNWDHPEAVDADLLAEQLGAYLAGEAITVPVYDFSLCSRSGECHLPLAPVVILEGLLALHWPGLRELIDLKVFVDVPEPLRLERRLRRDAIERGRSGDSVRRQWREMVAPMHRRFCEPTKHFADFIISGCDITPQAIRELLSRILF